MTIRHYYLPDEDAVSIHTSLQKGQRLVACLCAAWCSSCQGWQSNFSSLAKDFPEDCFVWIDIEEHPDLVAEVDLETLPVLLIQKQDTVCFLGAIQPQVTIVSALLSHGRLSQSNDDPGIHDFLLHPL